MSKTEWGNAVWLLFHTLAEKLDESFILSNKVEINDFIINICHNLPCPDCAKHAMETLKSAKLDNINSKEDLKYFFWSFHNIVNNKLNKPIVPIEYLELYKRAILINVIHNFREKFYKRSYNEKLLIQSFTFQSKKGKINNFLDKLIQTNFHKIYIN